jgi:glycosyltransferase involved in cell wall biosynthesis
LKNVIGKFQPDVIHVHNWHFGIGPIVFREANRMSIPIVHTLHNYRLLCPSGILFYDQSIFTDSLNTNFPWKGIKMGIYRNSIFQTFWLSFVVWFHWKIGTWDKIDRYVCLTEFSKFIFLNSRLNISESRLMVKPNFVLSRIQSNRDLPIDDYFLFVGRLSNEKGIELALNVAKRSGYKFCVVGEGDLNQLVLMAAQEFPNIEFMGNLENQAVIDRMYNAKALVFPSLWFEGMPMTIIEAFSCGTPVIASNLGAMSTMVVNGYNGLLFDPNDEDGLLNCMKCFCELSKEELIAYQDNAKRTFDEKYSESAQLVYLEKLYQFP